MRRLFVIILYLFVAGVMPAKAATDYPVRPITIIVPYAAGGTAEFFARLVAQDLTTKWGQKVIVEPRPGAGGNVGSALVAQANPDGYTLLLGTSGSNAVNPTLFANIPYDARKDLTLVATVAATQNVVVTSPKKPFKTIQDILTYARAHPGKATYASSGVGSVLHLSGALLGKLSGTQLLHVPYKGTSPALIDVMSGRVDMMVANAPSVVSLVKAGSLRALAVTGNSRTATLPGVPTVAETIPGYDLISWFAIMAPGKTPPDIVAKLNGEIDNFLGQSGTNSQLSAQGAAPLIMDASASEKFFVGELQKWGEIVKDSGARVD